MGGEIHPSNTDDTQSRVPFLQHFHLHHVVGRRRVLQPFNECIHEVLMVAREDTQVVPWLVLQLLIPVGVETHEDGRSAGFRTLQVLAAEESGG